MIATQHIITRNEVQMNHQSICEVSQISTWIFQNPHHQTKFVESSNHHLSKTSKIFKIDFVTFENHAFEIINDLVNS